ncbi:MAG: YecA family protein [Bacteroidota bacterium]
MDIGRNDPCHCGSGKKYKKCCLANDEATAVAKSVKEDYSSMMDYSEEDEAEFDSTFTEIANERNLPSGFYENLSPEENECLENWDKQFELLESPEDKLLHFEKILYDKPDLVEEIELDPEILFDINMAYLKLDKQSEYIQFLKRFRKDFPVVYSHNAEYYDYSIISYLLSSNKKEEISDYFSFFIEDPVKRIDRLMDLFNLLMALDEKEILLELTDKVKNKILVSDEIFGKHDFVIPLFYDMWERYLSKGLENIDYEKMVAEYQARLPYDLNEEGLENNWQKRFDFFWKSYQNWELNLKASKQEYKKIYEVVCDNFIRFLHEDKGLSIVSAQYHAALVEEFNKARLEKLKNVKNKPLFDFSKDALDKYSNSIIVDFFLPDLNRASSLYSAIYYFAEYLEVCDMVDKDEANEIKRNTEEMFAVVWEAVNHSFTESACFKKFPLW